MTIRNEVSDLAALGPLPNERADALVIAQHESCLEKISPPVSDEEAAILLRLFGEDDCHGLAWTLLHLVESAPDSSLASEPGADANEWLRRLWARSQRKVASAMTANKGDLVRELIARVKSRPGMYLQQHSLRELRAYLSGFCEGVDSIVRGLPSSYEGLGAFGDWLRARYGASSRTEWWDALLAEHRDDDEAAFKDFFTLWEEFLAQRKHS